MDVVQRARFDLPPPAPPALLPPPRGPSVWQALGMLLLYFALQLAVSSLIAFLVGLAVGLRHHGDSTAGTLTRAILSRADSQALLVIATLLIAGGLVLWLARRIWPQAWPRAAAPGFGFRRPRHAGFFAASLVIGLGVPILGGLFTQWLAHGHPVPQDIRHLGRRTSLELRVALALAVISIGPLVEELLFRGILLTSLLRTTAGVIARSRYVGAILLSGLLFGLVHLPDLGFFWFAVPNLVFLGLALGWLRLQSGSLWPCVLAHALNNALAITAWFVLAPPTP